ncbi:Prolamin-like domain - like 6 [Theobroma cacao]|nr:Prolamin-like domain - like 6 [Theobroma cacao]
MIMACKNVFVLLFILCVLASSAAAARELNGYNKASGHNHLTARHEVNIDSYKCWNALSQLNNCTMEIFRFFLNGHSGITRDCCGAIQDIYDCDPIVLISLGFTSEQENILLDYCYASFGPVVDPLVGSPLSAEALI